MALFALFLIHIDFNNTHPETGFNMSGKILLQNCLFRPSVNSKALSQFYKNKNIGRHMKEPSPNFIQSWLANTPHAFDSTYL